MQCPCSSAQTQNQTKQFMKIAQQNRVAKLSNGSDIGSSAPFAMVLEPYSITEEQFLLMKKMSKLWQKITHLASQDSEIIIKCFSRLVNDAMTGPMFEIYKEVVKSKEQKMQNYLKNKSENRGVAKPKIQLFRTDFFITDDKQNNIKLIEYNNVSVSMAGISQQFQKCQQEIWGVSKNLVDNKCTQTYAKGLISLYNKSQLSGIMLAVVQSREINIVDQNLLFEEITKNSKIKIERVEIESLGKQISMDENGDLFFKNDQKVSIVYYRAGYSSKQKIDWASIRKCNLSNAINIPDTAAFLTGTKRMQAQLSKKQVMRKYLTEQQAQLLEKSVIQTWDFEEEKNKQKVLQIMQKQGINNFVLKPNDEGGRNNYFGSDAYQKIKQMSEAQLLNYILTRRIRSRLQNCTLIKSKQWNCCPETRACQIESQVSIYGFVSSECQCNQKCGSNCRCGCMENCCQGFLVRCKPIGINQGGLIAGTGAIGGLQIKQHLRS